MLFTFQAMLQGAAHRCTEGLRMKQKQGADRLIIESGDTVSDKRQIKDVCVSCHQAQRQRMMLVIKYFILRTLQRDFSNTSN